MTQAILARLHIALAGILLLTPPLTAQSAPAGGSVVGRVISIAPDRSSVTLAPREGGRAVVWTVADLSDARERAKALHVGDVIAARTVPRNGALQIVATTPVTVTVPIGPRLLIVGGTAFVLWLIARLWAPGGVRWLVLGEDNRYSNSKVQLALWTWLLFTVYLATVLLRLKGGGLSFLGGVNVPANLLWLSGISVLTFAGAKQLVQSRADMSTPPATSVKAPPVGGPSFPRDLVTDDSGHRADLGDFQMLLVTLIAVLVYGARVFGWLGDVSLQASVDLPDVDTTLLSAFGIGQAAYLAKKAVGDVGTSAAPGAVDDAPPPRPPLAHR